MTNKETKSNHFEKFGEFAIKFEWINSSITFSISQLLRENGLRDNRFAHALTADLGADSLRSTWVSLLAIAFTLEEKELKIVKDISARYIKLIEHRNTLVHGLWPNEKTEIILGHKTHRTKKGVDYRSHDLTLEQLESFIKEADILGILFFRATICLINGHSLLKNFVLGVNGHYGAP